MSPNGGADATRRETTGRYAVWWRTGLRQDNCSRHGAFTLAPVFSTASRARITGRRATLRPGKHNNKESVDREASEGNGLRRIMHWSTIQLRR